MSANDFQIACDFYRTQVNKAFTPSYDQKIYFAALYNQAKHGPFSPEKAPEIGLLDFVGKERRAKWQSLGPMSTADAEEIFIQRLLQICPPFVAYLEATDTIPHFTPAPHELLSNDTASTVAVYGVHRNSHTIEIPSIPPLLSSLSGQESKIRTALNAQTQDQFKAYAVQYYPDDPDKQAGLIVQLQERHFHQYMEYFAVNGSITQPNEASSTMESYVNEVSTKIPETNGHDAVLSTTTGPSSPEPISHGLSLVAEPSGSTQTTVPAERMDQFTPSSSMSPPMLDDGSLIPAPQMWTRKDITEFKSLVSKVPDSVVSVGSGELVTIRVPGSKVGTNLVWEFATDDYDIGFGLFLEIASTSNKFKDETTSSSTVPWNLVQGSSQPPAQITEEVTSELIPIYRRTSHTDVYCGSCRAATEGTYLLKFDNTYSLWRNKVLYYRVYYAS